MEWKDLGFRVWGLGFRVEDLTQTVLFSSLRGARLWWTNVIFVVLMCRDLRVLMCLGNQKSPHSALQTCKPYTLPPPLPKNAENPPTAALKPSPQTTTC